MRGEGEGGGGRPRMGTTIMALWAPHRLGVPTHCEDLLREDTELLSHPQDSGCPCAGREVAEGQSQEAAGVCGEVEGAQSSPGTTHGGEDSAQQGTLTKLVAVGHLPACMGGGGCPVSAAAGGILSGFSRLGRLPIPQGQHAPLAPGLGCCCLGGTERLRLGASSTMGPGQRGLPPARPQALWHSCVGMQTQGSQSPRAGQQAITSPC